MVNWNRKLISPPVTKSDHGKKDNHLINIGNTIFEVDLNNGISRKK